MKMLPSRMFLDDFFNDVDKPKNFDKMMKCDIYEQDGKYVIEMDMPGVKKEDISMEIEKGYLTISYESKKDSQETDGKKYIRRERYSYTNCSRQFYVGEVDEEAINASFKDGILIITVPLKEEKETKKVINID